MGSNVQPARSKKKSPNAIQTENTSRYKSGLASWVKDSFLNARAGAKTLPSKTVHGTREKPPQRLIKCQNKSVTHEIGPWLLLWIFSRTEGGATSLQR